LTLLSLTRRLSKFDNKELIKVERKTNIIKGDFAVLPHRNILSTPRFFFLQDSWICFDQTFLGLGLGKLFPASESLVSDNPAGDRNSLNLFYSKCSLDISASATQQSMLETKYIEIIISILTVISFFDSYIIVIDLVSDCHICQGPLNFVIFAGWLRRHADCQLQS